MLLELIARYYNLLILALIGIALLKIILSYAFHGKLEGVNGILFALFAWYSEEEQEMEEGTRRTIMRILNIVTISMYATLALMFLASILPRIFGR